MLLRGGDEGGENVRGRICQRESIDVGCGNASGPSELSAVNTREEETYAKE